MADVKDKDRQDRLAAALRENLKRRKAQLRGRTGRLNVHTRDRADTGTADETAGEPEGREKPA